jgi:hypothetical protein
MRPLALAVSLLLGCATGGQSVPIVTVTPWVIIPSDETMPAHLRHHDSKIDQTLDFDHAAEYRCYAPEDDIAIRNLIAALRAMGGSL